MFRYDWTMNSAERNWAMPKVQHKLKNRTIAIRYGAAVERAEDGKFNFFTHPHNCAFGAPLPQSQGDFETRDMAWEMCGAVIDARGSGRSVTWL